MNNRIRQLAIEADIIAPTWNTIPSMYEKFAELIARECVHLCIRELPDPRDTPEGLCAKRIVEHFGLEK